MALCLTYVTPVVAGGTATTSLNVRLQVDAGCAVATGGDVNFGTVAGASGQPPNAVTSLTVTCTAGTPYKVTFTGQNDGVGGATKTLSGTGTHGHTLSYSIVLTGSPSTVFGSDQNTNAMSGTGTGLPQITSLSARLNNWSVRSVTPDVYSDVVTVTVNY